MTTKAPIQTENYMYANEILDVETYNQRLSKLQIESDVLLSNKPFNNLKVNKSRVQLFELLKRHNEKYKISTDELPRTHYRLGQLGAKWNQIEQDLAMEKFKIDKKNEEIIHEKPSLFAVNLRSEQNLAEYLEKNLSFQLFNKVDATTNNEMRQINGLHRKFLFETYMDKTAENRKQMQLQKKNFTFYKKLDPFPETIPSTSRMSSKEQLSIKQGFLVMDAKQRSYFEAFEKYIQSKYIFLNTHPEVKHEFSLVRLINEFFEITTSYDIKSIWLILSSQVKICEDFYANHTEILEFFEDFKQNSKLLKQKSNNPLYGKNLLSIFLSSQSDLRKKILKRSCEILEEEFYESLPKVENSSISIQSIANLDVTTIKNIMPILTYIEKNYLNSEFRAKSQNFIEFDENETPIWAILYVLMRAGLKSVMLKVIRNYQGRSKVSEFGEFFEKYVELQQNNKELDVADRKTAMDFFLNSNENIDVFQYSLYIIVTKYCEIFSVELINYISDYIWFNLKLCDFQEEEGFKRGDLQRKTMILSEFQQNFIEYSSQMANNSNPLIDLKTLFLILCYEEALGQFKNIESYFNDFVHILIIVRESGLIFDFSDEKCKNLDLKEIIYKYVRNFVGSRPLEAFHYFRILPKKDMISLISSCIINSDLLGYFFESNYEAKNNCKKLHELLGFENFKDVINDIIKNVKSSNLEMALKLFDLINDYEKVMNLIIEYESQKILSIPKKNPTVLSKEKNISLQNTINSLLSNYKSSGKLDTCKDSNQIIMLLNYIIKIKTLLEEKSNERRFEECLRKLKEWKLIPMKEEENEKYMDFYIMLNRRKSIKIYLELLILSLEILREIRSQNSRIQKPLFSIEEVKAISSNLYNFFHNYIKNVEIEEIEEKETLKKLNDEAHKTSIIF